MNRPAVEDARPPKAVLRLVNPIMVALLRSRLHRLASKNCMLLTVTGRKSGRSYTLPVTRHEQPDGTLVVSAGGFLGAWDQFRVAADEYRELDAGRVLVLIHRSGRGRTSGLDVEQMCSTAADLFHIEDGKVTRLVNYWDRKRALDDLGLAE